MCSHKNIHMSCNIKNNIIKFLNLFIHLRMNTNNISKNLQITYKIFEKFNYIQPITGCKIHTRRISKLA